MNRADVIEELAPAAPPCFDSRMQWVEYLKSAAAAQKQDRGEPGPLVFEAGQPVRFNHEFAFCVDCNAPHSLQMSRAGRCHPDFLRLLPRAHEGALAPGPAPVAVAGASS